MSNEQEYDCKVYCTDGTILGNSFLIDFMCPLIKGSENENNGKPIDLILPIIEYMKTGELYVTNCDKIDLLQVAVEFEIDDFVGLVISQIDNVAFLFGFYCLCHEKYKKLTIPHLLNKINEVLDICSQKLASVSALDSLISEANIENVNHIMLYNIIMKYVSVFPGEISSLLKYLNLFKMSNDQINKLGELLKLHNVTLPQSLHNNIISDHYHYHTFYEENRKRENEINNLIDQLRDIKNDLEKDTSTIEKLKNKFQPEKNIKYVEFKYNESNSFDIIIPDDSSKFSINVCVIGDNNVGKSYISFYLASGSAPLEISSSNDSLSIFNPKICYQCKYQNHNINLIDISFDPAKLQNRRLHGFVSHVILGCFDSLSSLNFIIGEYTYIKNTMKKNDFESILLYNRKPDHDEEFVHQCVEKGKEFAASIPATFIYEPIHDNNTRESIFQAIIRHRTNPNESCIIQ